MQQALPPTASNPVRKRAASTPLAEWGQEPAQMSQVAPREPAAQGGTRRPGHNVEQPKCQQRGADKEAARGGGWEVRRLCGGRNGAGPCMAGRLCAKAQRSEFGTGREERPFKGGSRGPGQRAWVLLPVGGSRGQKRCKMMRSQQQGFEGARGLALSPGLGLGSC